MPTFHPFGRDKPIFSSFNISYFPTFSLTTQTSFFPYNFQHVTRGYIHALGGFTKELEPVLPLQGQLYLLARFQIVVNGHRHGDLVTLGERQGEVYVHEKVLEDADGGCGRSQAAILGMGQGGL